MLLPAPAVLPGGSCCSYLGSAVLPRKRDNQAHARSVGGQHGLSLRQVQQERVSEAV